MNTKNPIPVELVAPCGMNCAICSRYQAYVHGLKKSGCAGCRPGSRTCAYLMGRCAGHPENYHQPDFFCTACGYYPCKDIVRMDKRYQKNYGMSVMKNLEAIQTKGIVAFIETQYEKHRCTRCGGLISVHNRKCFHCDEVTRLVEKEP